MSKISFSVHTGTHVDAPSHINTAAWESGKGVEALNLEVLNGKRLSLAAGHLAKMNCNELVIFKTRIGFKLYKSI